MMLFSEFLAAHALQWQKKHPCCYDLVISAQEAYSKYLDSDPFSAENMPYFVASKEVESKGCFLEKQHTQKVLARNQFKLTKAQFLACFFLWRTEQGVERSTKEALEAYQEYKDGYYFSKDKVESYLSLIKE